MSLATAYIYPPLSIHPYSTGEMTSMDLDSPITNPEDENSFLGTLAACPTIKKHPYSKVRELWDRRIAQMRECENEFESEWILLTDINNQTFTRDFLNDDLDSSSSSSSSIPITWSTFDPKLNLLLIRMSNLAPHERAAATFNELFLDAVKPTGLKYSLNFLGKTAFCGANGAKRGDFSYAPHAARLREWPAECGSGSGIYLGI